MPCDWLLQSHDMMLGTFNGQIITSEDTDRLSNIRNSKDNRNSFTLPRLLSKEKGTYLNFIPTGCNILFEIS